MASAAREVKLNSRVVILSGRARSFACPNGPTSGGLRIAPVRHTLQAVLRSFSPLTPRLGYSACGSRFNLCNVRVLLGPGREALPNGHRPGDSDWDYGGESLAAVGLPLAVATQRWEFLR